MVCGKRKIEEDILKLKSEIINLKKIIKEIQNPPKFKIGEEVLYFRENGEQETGIIFKCVFNSNIEMNEYWISVDGEEDEDWPYDLGIFENRLIKISDVKKKVCKESKNGKAKR